MKRLATMAGAAGLLLCGGALQAQMYPYGSPYGPAPQAAYAQPQYAQPQAYGQGYPSQGFTQQPYAAPGQGYGQAYPPGGYAQQGYAQAQPSSAGQPLNADQLEQLVAPIALYPDTLVAQVLAASTYPAQVVDADRWLQAQGNVSPYQIAGGADVQNWDPSVKGLTAFPQVLAEMDRNVGWTTALGNAYYNQPQDVLEAVQVMRQRAQAAGNLRDSPQEQVSYDAGAIELAPSNPQMVYVPQYNPWAVYGDPVAPYPGFSLLGAIGSFFSSGLGSSALQYGLGIATAAFTHTPWGLLSWAVNWLGHALLFNHSTYDSQSTTVANWGLPRGGGYAFAGSRYGGARGQYNGSGGYGGGYGAGAPVRGVERPLNGYAPIQRAYAPIERYNRPQVEAYNRIPAPVQRAPENSRPENRLAYGPEAYGGGTRAYAAPAQTYRTPAPQVYAARGDFTGRESFNPGSFKAEKTSKEGGFHLFGDGNKEPKFSEPKYSEPKFKEPKFKEPKFKEPKMSGGKSSGHSSGHSGGHHW